MIYLYVSIILTLLALTTSIGTTIGFRRRTIEHAYLIDNKINGRRIRIADIRLRQWLTRMTSAYTKLIIGLFAVGALLTGDGTLKEISTLTLIAGFFLSLLTVAIASFLDLRSEDMLDKEI